MLRRLSASPRRSWLRRRMVDPAVLILAALTALVLLIGAVLAWDLGGGSDAARPAPRAHGPAVTGAGLVPATDPGPPMPNPARLAAALRGPLADPGFSGPPEMEVRDLRTGDLLFGQQQQVPQAPASTAKLLTSAVALTEIGPQTRLQTKAYLAGTTLYLVGGGDPTLTRGPGLRLSSPPAQLSDLAKQIKAAGVTSADAVVGDDGLFTGPALAVGWPPYYLQSQVAPVSALTVDEGRGTPTPALAASDALRTALGAEKVVTGPARLGKVPPGARLVGTVSSPPLSALVEYMLTNSDNNLAEAIGRLVAVASGQGADFVGASSALLDGLRRLGLPTAGVQLHDASGLSPADLVPPALLVDVLRMASDPAHPELQSIITGLPVAGRTGTLAARFHSADTRAGAGVIHAKSGRLLGINALAGLVTTTDGRTLVFALRAPTGSLGSGEQAMDRVATTLAQCGCR